MRRWPNKDPNERLDYSMDLSDLLDSGDSIQGVDWIVPDGITKDDESVSGEIATVWLSGGTSGRTYDITARLTTTAGRVFDRSIKLKVTNR